VIMGNQRLWSALEEREQLYAKTAMTDEEGMRLGELEGIVGDEDGYTAESDAAILLQGLDIPDALHERRMAELQGGQKVRVLLAKTQIGSRVESQNEQREKKIAQLQDFIARFSAGTRASQVMSRKKEVERLQTTELARSNIQRPYIRFPMNRPSGRVALECTG